MAQLQSTGITGSLTVLGSITGSFSGSFQSQEYELITKTIADGTPTSIDFTLDASKYKIYKLIMAELGIPAAAGSGNWAQLQLSSNSGSTFQTVEYVLQSIQSSSAGIPNGNSTGTQAFLTNAVLTSAARLTGESIITMQPNVLIQTKIAGVNSTPRLNTWLSFDRATDTALSNFIRLSFTSNNAITGSIYLLGLRK